MSEKKKISVALICGILGCFCIGGGDWLMLYGDPSYTGNLSWLTVGASMIPQWRYSLAMLLAFPGIILYGIALFSVEHFIPEEKHKKVYHYLNAFGLTPWLALHLFYIMILSLFAWLTNQGFADSATTICEALFQNFTFVVLVSEVFMIPVFLYWFYLQITGKTVFAKGYAFTNVLFLFVVLKVIQIFLPVSAFRIAFTNGLMSESMVIWFIILLIQTRFSSKLEI